MRKLSRKISPRELQRAILSLPSNKAPGPDGLPGEFYKSLSKTISPMLLNCLNSFLKGHPIPADFKRGLLTTIYKGKGDPLEISNRRPISLLNIDYKILSRILNFRLLKVVKKIISPHQNGFIPDRSIFSNIICLEDAIFTARTTHQNTVISLIDFEKAFDSISHVSIEKILTHIGCPPAFSNTIMEMIIGSTSQVSVKGFLSNPFEIQRGTKQGDPISPTLFALVIETLSKSLNKDRKIQGAPAFGGTKLKILLFADDIVLLSRNKEDLEIQLSHLKTYELATSSRISQLKSRCLTFKEHTSLPFPSPSDQGERYLGYTITHQGLLPRHEQILQENINSMEKWKTKGFSELGKATILKSYSLSRLWYNLTLETPNKHFISRLSNTINWFLWSSNLSYLPNKKYRSRMNLNSLTAPKKEGGLGLWDLQTRISALKAQLLHSSLKSPDLLHMEIWSKKIDFTIRTRKLNPMCPNDDQPFSTGCPLLDECIYSWRRLGIWPSNLSPNAKTTEVRRALVNEPPLCLREIYNILSPPHPAPLTSKQKQWADTWGIDFKTIWKTILSAKTGPKITNLAWRIYTSTLPKSSSEGCASCHKSETSVHLFFYCPNARLIVKEAENLWQSWTNEPLHWVPDNILPLPVHKHHNTQRIHFIFIVLWTIWIRRNNIKHSNEPLPKQAVVHKLSKEMSRVAHLFFHEQMNNHSKLKKEWFNL
jgi:hypothetical protein